MDDKHLTIEGVEGAVCSVKGSIGVGAHLALDALVAAHVAVDPPPLADVERDGHHDHAQGQRHQAGGDTCNQITLENF